MAKIRQARRCAAHRTDGRPCRGYAIRGGSVCAAHGGSARQVRAAARLRLAEAATRRAMAADLAATGRALAAWRARRVAAVATVTGDDPAFLAANPAWLAGAELLYGIPAPPLPRPHRDRRFRANRARRV